MAVYRGTHRSQYDGSPLANENCTPTSGANGARVVTEGRIDKSGAQVRALIPRSEEDRPETPGWSLGDLDRAMVKLDVPFVIGAGGWAGVRLAHARGEPVVLQGDSDQFGLGTCSGAFDGNHAVCVHPETVGSRWLLADPICRSLRWEEEAVLRAYATKFNPGISYGVFAMKNLVQLHESVRSGIDALVVEETTFRQSPSGDAEPSGVAKVGRRYPFVGYLEGGWRAVRVSTPIPAGGGEPKPYELYLRASTVELVPAAADPDDPTPFDKAYVDKTVAEATAPLLVTIADHERRFDNIEKEIP